MTDKVIVFFDINSNNLEIYNIAEKKFTLNKKFTKVNMLKQCGPQALQINESCNKLLCYLENHGNLYDLEIYELSTFKHLQSHKLCAVLLSNPN